MTKIGNRFKHVPGEEPEHERRSIWSRLSLLETKQKALEERLIRVELRSGIYKQPDKG